MWLWLGIILACALYYFFLNFGARLGIADFFCKFLGINRLMDWLEERGMSEEEKRKWRRQRARMERLKAATRAELQEEYQAILSRHAGRYEDSAALDRSLVAWLPRELQMFFAQYDYLRFYAEKTEPESGEALKYDERLVDVKALKIIEMVGVEYIIIGSSNIEEDRRFQVVRKQTAAVKDGTIFDIDQDLENPDNPDENLQPGMGEPDLQHLVCSSHEDFQEWLEDTKDR